MMRRCCMRVFIVLLCLLSTLDSFGGVFNTSRCFDLLCTPQYIDNLKEDARFAGLFADSVFVAGVADINSNCSASRLCNLYSEVNGDRTDISKCLFAIQHLDSLASEIEWAKGILTVQPQLAYVLQKLVDNGYSEYWEQTVYPRTEIPY